jgi:hypothetical protein
MTKGERNMSKLRSSMLVAGIVAASCGLLLAIANAQDSSSNKILSGVVNAQDGSDETIPSEIRALRKSLGIKAETLSVAALPLQMRTAYAIGLGGQGNYETVVSVSNFSKATIRIEVEFFTGFNFFQRGIGRLTLKPGETGEIATAGAVPPFVINAIRDSSVPFEGYANVHAETADIAAHCHMVYNNGDDRSYQSIKVFRTREGRPIQQGD